MPAPTVTTEESALVTAAEGTTLAGVFQPLISKPLNWTAAGRSSLDDRKYAPPAEGVAPLAEYELASGRLSRLPVAAYWKGTLTVPGAHRLQLTQFNCQGNEDTAMIATFTEAGVPYTFYNDNHAVGGGNGKCSYLDLGTRAGPISYTVYVFSRTRATAPLYMWFDTGGGAGWQYWTSGVQVGGTLVKVGALESGEWLEVRTRANGLDGVTASDTNMLLFQTAAGFNDSGSNFVTKAALLADNQSPSDADPRLAVDASWNSNPHNYVLLGKVASSTASNRTVETSADLLRGPEGAASWRTFSSGQAAYLTPGRYLVALYATVARPVGGYVANDPTTYHLAGNMPGLADGNGDTNGCPSVARGDWSPDSRWYRGQHNQRAFRMWLESSADGVTFVQHGGQRPVMRGALGSLAGNHDRFTLELFVSQAGYYRLRTASEVSDLSISDWWFTQRNAETSELKVASANVLFGPQSFTANEMRNYANLLGTRGSVVAAQSKVEDREDQGPFQWEADIFGLQEANKSVDGNDPDDTYTDILLAELKARGSSDWEYVRARGETWTWGLSDGPGMNPLYVKQSMWPTNSPSSIVFSAAARANGPYNSGGCSNNGGRANYFECQLSESGASGEIVNYMSGARTKVFRDGSTNDRPIGVFNLHLEASDGAADFNARSGEVDDLIRTMKDLLVSEPTAFNRAGSNDPKHSQNRMIVFGDWNTRTHECGEHYWVLRRLREEFGYAVDVAMATPDRAGNATLGMHTRDDGYFGASDWPVGFQYAFWTQNELSPVVAWNAEDPRNFTSISRYPVTNDHRSLALHPWWGSTGRTKTPGMGASGERYDLIILVGRGWSTDDPVLEYKVMVDRNKNNMNNGSLMDNTGRAVNMWKECNTSLGSVLEPTEAGYVAGKSYSPNWNLGCGPGPGKSAIHTDHRPVGARLRVWSQ